MKYVAVNLDHAYVVPKILVDLRPGILIAVLLTVFSLSSLYAMGSPEVPSIPPSTSGTTYISPNGDGVKDEATISFEARLYVKSKEGYIPEYGLTITSPEGKVIKKIVEKEKRDIGWFASLFTGYKEFALERSITWDGKDADGTLVSDGTYQLAVWVADADGKRKEQQLDEFVVDTRAPDALIVEPEELVFSPNGDGRKDRIKISHTKASEEEKWTGHIRNGDKNTVRSYEWSGKPEDIVWDGTNDEGEPVAEGTYSYVLEASDRAGNESGEIVLGGIELDRTETPIELLIEPGAFSPNGDGKKDTATVYLDQAVKEGIVGWSYTIKDIHNTIYDSERNEGPPPLEFELDGTTLDGKRYPQDRYIFTYSVEYEHGNKPSAEENFRIDVSDPRIEVRVENPIFSPDGDGRKEDVRIFFTSDEKVSWKGSVIAEDGDVVYSTDSERTTSLIVWDGRDKSGELVSDGSYTLTGSFIDEAGNAVEPSPVKLVVDTKPVSVKVATEEGFSPNGDGVNDTLPIGIESSQHEAVQRWKLELAGSSGEVKRVFSGTETLPKSLEWDGDLLPTDEGTRESAPQGAYTGKMTVEYEKGKTAKAETEPFFLDVTPPDVAMKVTKNPFAQRNGEVEGEVFIGVDIEEKETRVRTWTMDILNKEGDVIRSYTGSDDPSDDIAWNSPSEENRRKFGDEQFTLKIEVTDAGGNTKVFTEEVSLDIFLVKKNGKYHIAVPNIIFGAYQHTLDSKGPKIEERNIESLKRVVDIYNRYPDYGLLLEGHALNIYRGVNEEKREEEEKVLRPLTVRRADTVRDALLQRGMDGDKIETEAFGGSRPIVSVRDRSVRWKNRRVEFIMKEPRP